MLFSFAAPHPSKPGPRDGDGLGPDLDAVPADDAAQVREEIRATLATLTPWGLSILVHSLLVVLAFFLVWQTIVPEPGQQVVPEIGHVSAPKVPMEIEMAEAAASASSLEVFTPITPPTPPTKPTMVGQTPAPVRLFDPRDAVLPPVFPPAPSKTNTRFGPFGVAIGDGTGDKDGDGDPDGGDLNKIVYIVDASGSMVDVLPFVVNELKRVFNEELGKEQQVTVLFFSGEGVFEVPGGDKAKGLRPVTPAFKQRFNEWATLANHQVKTGGRGSAFVYQALTTALAYKPGAIYLLSDNLTGGGQGATQHELFQEDLIGLIRKQNKSTPAAKMSTIQFLYQDPLVQAGMRGTLQRIAEETGGVYKFISQRDLNLR